jgi:hypothetical protein
MSNILSRRSVLAAALGGVVATTLRVRADGKQLGKLNLASGYSGKILVDGARRVFLSATRDEKGEGSGTLTFDPNITDGIRSTTIGIRSIPIRLQLVRDEERITKGRRLYELTRTGAKDEGEIGGERWFLIQPLKEGAPHWLVFADKDGKFLDTLMLEPVA